MKKLITVLAIIASVGSYPLLAETFTSKDWRWSSNNQNFYYAATTNSSGHIFGQYCYFDSESCLYIVTLGVTCDEDAEYPVIFNSNKGSGASTVTCAKEIEGVNAFFISNFDDIDNIVRQGSKIGIAVPMDDGKFKVVRFSLSGSEYAIDLMRAASELKINAKSGSNDSSDEQYL